MHRGGAKYKILLTTLALGMALAGLASSPSTAATLSYLDNGRIRLGLDAGMGGAISYLAKSGGGSNLINNWDFGRETQLSFYSGPVPFAPPGATLDPSWRGLGWNPIQAGDAFKHGSRVVDLKNDGRTIRLRCVPMIWPLNNVPAECVFDCTYRLSGNTVEVDNRLLNARSDRTQYPGRCQELPAVYSNGAWYKLVSYTGDAPFTGAPTTNLVDLNDGRGWPWLTFYGTEHWAALLDKNDWGLGVFEPEATRFGGGFAGQPKGTGGPTNDQTGYIAPNLDEILDYNINYSFRYVLIVGRRDEIRRYAAEHTRAEAPPRWVFKTDRQHWIYENTTDTGWPIQGELRVKLGPPGAALVSPEILWPVSKTPVFRMDAAFAAGREISLFIQTSRQNWIGPVKVPVTPDGKYRPYQTNLAGVDGAVRRVKIVLPKGAGLARIRSIGF
jgi:hypothetical protein